MTDTEIAVVPEAAVAVQRLGIGIHPGISEERYHADPCETPSASSSILKTLVDRSPLHAWWDHPRLNPDIEPRKTTPAQSNGTILHSMILGTPEPFRVLDFDSYRTNAAKAKRDVCIADGKIPLLTDDYAPLANVGTALRKRVELDHPQIHAALHDPATLFEVTIVCLIRKVLCRVRIDCLPPASYGFALDLKFTSRSAEPEGWGKKMISEYLFQADLYSRAIKAARGDSPEFRFIVCETDGPYGVSVHAMDPQAEDLASRKVNHALDMWSACLTGNRWPSYSSETHYQEPQPWVLAQWEGREFRASKERPGETYARLHAAAGGPPT